MALGLGGSGGRRAPLAPSDQAYAGGGAYATDEVDGAGAAWPGGRRSDGPRPVLPRRGRLNGRALLGGFLVSLSAVGLFAAYTAARRDPRLRYVVAAHQIAPGHRLVPADLATEPMWLPDALATGEAFRAPGSLVGAVAVAPLRAGELIQASAVLAGDAVGYDQEVSFPLDPARAVDGTLRPGETVAVLATYGSGQQAVSVVVVPWAHVLSVDGGVASLGTRPAETVTLGLDSASDALAVTNAVDAGQVELVRTREPEGGATPFRSPGASGAGQP